MLQVKSRVVDKRRKSKERKKKKLFLMKCLKKTDKFFKKCLLSFKNNADKVEKNFPFDKSELTERSRSEMSHTE